MIAARPAPARGEPLSPAATSSRPRRRALARFAVYLACAAALGLLVACRSARVATAAREVVALKEELRLVEADNRRLELEAERLASLDRIEREATLRLGMVRPARVYPLPPPPSVLAAAPPPAPPAPAPSGPEVHLGAAADLRLNPEAVATVRALAARLARLFGGG